MFKGVLFDLDGVITDTAEFHYLAWKKLGDEIGIPFDRSFNEQLKGVSREDSLTLLLAHGKRRAILKTEFPRISEKKNDYYLEMIQSITPKDVFQGFLELLKDLRATNIKISTLASAKQKWPFPTCQDGFRKLLLTRLLIRQKSLMESLNQIFFYLLRKKSVLTPLVTASGSRMQKLESLRSLLVVRNLSA